jgi:membrane protease YdiL (CAAX protease family)
VGEIVIHSNWWTGVARVALFMVTCVLVLITAGAAMPRLPDLWSQAILGVSTSIVTFALTVLFARWDGLELKDVGAAIASRSWLRLAIGFLIGLGLVGLQASIVGVVGHIRWVRSPEVGFSATSTALAVYLVLSCREELAFRGYPLRRLDCLFGPYAAQLFVALVFAIEHVAGGSSWTTAVLGVATGSLLFGMAALATRGLAIPIGLHAAWNFGQWVLGGKEMPGLWRAVNPQEVQAHLERVGMTIYVIVMVLATLAFWCLYKRRMRTDRP